MTRNGQAHRLQPVLAYAGAKWTIAPWIIAHFPAHDCYLEPYFGSGAVLLAKEPARAEIANDLDGRVVGLFQVIRDQPLALAQRLALTPYSRAEYDRCRSEPDTGDPIEDARRFLVLTWQQIGRRTLTTGSLGGWRSSSEGFCAPTSVWSALPTRVFALAARLQHVQWECRPALDVIVRHDRPGVLIYADPPYVTSTRSRALYRHEMTDQDHRDLLLLLRAHRGPVAISGYRSDLYDALLHDWRRVDRMALAQRGQARTESLWLNPAASPRQPSLL